MMKPGPLKDKISKACDVDNLLDVCRVMHIKEAVDWLKEEFCICNPCETGDKCPYCNKINEAFEDVTNK